MSKPFLTTSMLRCAIVSWAALTCAHAQGVSLRPQIVGSNYCIQDDGLALLELTVKLDFGNSGKVPLILLRVTPLLSWRLSAPDGDGSERSEEFGAEQIFDGSQLDPSAPDLRLFVVLAPGETYVWQVQVRIALRAGPRKTPLLGSDQNLTLTVNPWPDRRASGEPLKLSWASLGFLWLDPITSSSAQLHIEGHPRVGQCVQPAIF